MMPLCRFGLWGALGGSSWGGLTVGGVLRHGIREQQEEVCDCVASRMTSR